MNMHLKKVRQYWLQGFYTVDNLEVNISVPRPPLPKLNKQSVVYKHHGPLFTANIGTEMFSWRLITNEFNIVPWIFPRNAVSMLQL